MDDQPQRNHTASLRYINSLNAEMHSTGVLKKRKTTGKIWEAFRHDWSYYFSDPPLS